MILRKTLLAASAVALVSMPTWALADQNPSDHGAKHAPSTTPAGPPSTTPNNANSPGASNRSQNGNHGADKGTGDQVNHGSGQDNQDQGNDPGKQEHPGHPQHPKHPDHPEHPDHPKHPSHLNHPSHPGNSHKCMPRNVAYIVSGTLVTQTLSKNANGTYSGTVTVDVTHTNRHAVGDKGTQGYTLAEARVKLRVADIDHDGSVELDDLVAGDRVKVIGSITTLSKKCSESGFTATTTIRKVIFHAPVTPGS
jgi:hypothetical protein